ncbi:hypothetical protein KKC87_00440, partial [Patescibacteria group bacterium]|nr:hypothetical protein [Patescibacteria group bacterium]
DQFPNVLGMHEFGLYINQLNEKGERSTQFALPSDLQCEEQAISAGSQLTLCEFLQYYRWKRTMFEQGKFNKSI